MQFRGGPSSGRVSKQPITANRRSRVPLSCDNCRMRKLKCNREKPCQNCSARNEQTNCEFRGPKNAVSAVHRGSHGDGMHQRIDHLEDMVKKLIADREQASQPSVSSASASESPVSGPASALVVASCGPENSTVCPKTMIDGAHSVYVGGQDWYSVLQEINELKKTWGQEQEREADPYLQLALPHTVDGTSLLFSQANPIDRVEILSSLPPKLEASRLVNYFFDHDEFPISVPRRSPLLPPSSMNNIHSQFWPAILHMETFMREYEDHWKDPSATNLIWLGLLFSILGTAMLAYMQYGEPAEYAGLSEVLFQKYRLRAAQCLQGGDISKCVQYTVEALRLNATAELNRKDDNNRGLWIMTGVIVRAAINMGYHRDRYATNLTDTLAASHLSGITVVQAEYRRRTWSSVVGMDEMVSFVGGFPRLMSSIYSDTAEPRNIHNWELPQKTTVLPPSRPLTEDTEATYLIAKGRLFRSLGQIADFNCMPHLGSYQTVLDIDQDLENTYQNLPVHMRSSSIVEKGPEKALRANKNYFTSISLLCLYYKGIIILHRRFLARASVDAQFKFSKDRCISSALALLALQKGLDPGFYRLALTRQILMLAAMTLILEMELRRRALSLDAATDDGAALMHALEQSCAYWDEAAQVCDEASKTHQSLLSLLSDLRDSMAPAGTDTSLGVSPETPQEPSDFSPRFDGFDLVFSLDKNSLDAEFDWTYAKHHPVVHYTMTSG
ncbi:hypothetical protein PG999_007409 [Apiospora kogelbergensis]|uniref:Zn(2)-C6 fungal-type domain-containing protein n=1 Tax=Apiospora kogelbergensis TaxID=1337665 RepID=A0AAW0QY78_9PEZI